MKNIKCILLEDIAQVGKKRLDEKFNLEIGLGLSRNDILQRISDCNFVVVKGSTLIDEEFLDVANKLQLIARAGTGLDNIDLDLANKYGVRVINTPLANTNSAIEFTITQILSVSRNIKNVLNSVKSKDFRRSLHEGSEIKAKVVGLIGLGGVGIGVAKILKSFEAKLIAYDPYTQYGNIFCKELGGKIVTDINQIAEESNIISLHMSLNNENTEIINSKFLNKTTKSPILINSARGGLVNEDDIIKSLKDNQISFYATDFTNPEPPYDDLTSGKNFKHIFLSHPKIFYTPHIGASTIEAQNRVANELVDSICSFYEINA